MGVCNCSGPWKKLRRTVKGGARWLCGLASPGDRDVMSHQESAEVSPYALRELSDDHDDATKPGGEAPHSLIHRHENICDNG